YSNIPGHKHSLEYLFFGLEHHGQVYNNLVPFMWASVLLCFGSLGVFAYMKITKMSNDLLTGLACLAIFVALWLDKGLGFVMGGLVVNPLDEITEYYPTANEIGITLGIWATGFFLITVLYKIAVKVDHEVEG
ncbi:MAG: sulfate reduction electron transfer complex DsrMKJOP subunit DsrP, partial [Desulforhopalus sp.]